ncbi:hypothetical protein SAMN06265339_0916 [Desulfurobacterium pacificum]|uniref:Fibronectin type-III domain-containing protein n=1 Tax=Desulfurobacterium pacificum TaxID=240166 RepID=A0ABY1NJJ0_9BACT|nr:hypothetical protein [Desulfurobacterium pacificum]SMP11341.1 hypothetical protein SAMN06265339_0916 [Desulfurobacterium pacificum]
MKKVLFLSLLPLLFSFTMCGNRGAPLPPYTKIPATPSITTIQQHYKKVVIAWNPVTTYRDGRKLPLPSKVSYVVIVNFGKKKVKTEKTYYSEAIKRFNTKMCYSVVSVYEGRKSEPANPVCILVKKPIAEVPVVENATAGDGFVSFTFSPSRYSIEIFRNAQPPYLKPLKVLPPQTTSFTDKGLKNGKTYLYKFRYAEGVYKGKLSRTYKLTPADKIPPLPPKNPLLILSPKGCTLVWEPSPSKDVVSYKIVADTGNFTLSKDAIYFQFKSCPKKVGIEAVDKAGNVSKLVVPREVLK